MKTKTFSYFVVEYFSVIRGSGGERRCSILTPRMYLFIIELIARITAPPKNIAIARMNPGKTRASGITPGMINNGERITADVIVKRAPLIR